MACSKVHPLINVLRISLESFVQTQINEAVEMWGGGVIIPFSVELEQDWMDADIGGTLDAYKAENPTHKRFALELIFPQFASQQYILFFLMCDLPLHLFMLCLSASMMPRILKSGYAAMQLVHYFTAGEDEVKAWTIKDGWLAPQAAGVIHTDFERGLVIASSR